MHHAAAPPPPPPYGAEAKTADMFSYTPASGLAASTASAYSAASGANALYAQCPAGVPLLQSFLNPFPIAGPAAAAAPAAAPLLPSLVTSAPLSLAHPQPAAPQPQPAQQQFFPIATPQLAQQPQLQATNLLSQQQLQQLQIQLQLQQLQQQQQQIQQLQQQQQQQQQQYAALQQRFAANSQAIMLVPIGVDQTGAQQFLPQMHPMFPSAAGGLALPPECPMSRVGGFNALGAAGVPLIPAGAVIPTPPPLATMPARVAAAAQFHGGTPNGSITSFRNALPGQPNGAAVPPTMQRCPVAHDSASRTAAHNHRSSLRQRRRQALIADYEKLESAASVAGTGDPSFFVPLTGDVHRQALQRRKQVLFGRATRGYIHYLLAVPPMWRQRAAPVVPDAPAAGGCPFRHGAGEDGMPSLDLSGSVSVTGRPSAAPAHPRTPRSDLRCSKRSWDAVVGRWRAQLRQWDNPLFAADAVGTALKAFGVEPPGLTSVRESPQTAATSTPVAPVAPRATGCPVLAAINEAERAESVRSGGSTPSLGAGSHVSRPAMGGSAAHPMFPAAYVRRLYPHVVHFLREVQRLFPPRSEGAEGEGASPRAAKPRRGAGGDESSEDEEESMSQSSVSQALPQQRVSLLPADIEALFAALGRVEEPDDADDERIVAKHRAVERLMEELSRAVVDASSALTDA